MLLLDVTIYQALEWSQYFYLFFCVCDCASSMGLVFVERWLSAWEVRVLNFLWTISRRSGFTLRSRSVFYVIVVTCTCTGFFLILFLLQQRSKSELSFAVPVLFFFSVQLLFDSLIAWSCYRRILSIVRFFFWGRVLMKALFSGEWRACSLFLFGSSYGGQ